MCRPVHSRLPPAKPPAGREFSRSFNRFTQIYRCHAKKADASIQFIDTSASHSTYSLLSKRSFCSLLILQLTYLNTQLMLRFLLNYLNMHYCFTSS